jgi:hypothetical protein
LKAKQRIVRFLADLADGFQALGPQYVLYVTGKSHTFEQGIVWKFWSWVEQFAHFFTLRAPARPSGGRLVILLLQNDPDDEDKSDDDADLNS